MPTTSEPSPRTVPEAVAAHGSRTPDGAAFLDLRGDALTWGHLHDRSQQIARGLRSLGVGPSDAVLVACPAGLSAPLATLAAATAACAVPVDPDLPTEAANRRLGLLPVAALIADDPASPVARWAAARGVPVVDASDTPAASLGTADPIRPDPAAVGLLIPTSGTTGEPRWVPRTHANLLATAVALGRAYGLEPGERGLAIANQRSGVGSTVVAGSTLVVTGPYRREAFVDALVRFRPAWFWAVPSVLHDLTDHLEGHPETRALLRLRFVRSTAMRLDPGLRDRAAAALGAPVLDGYGLSEAAPIALETLGDHGHDSVGHPCFPVRVVGDDGTPLPEGEVGEIETRGPHVFPGYRDDPSATAAAFAPDGWFRTGDLGTLGPDGRLRVVGRRKEMVNRGGTKIAPFEVETALERHPSVREAAVLPAPHPTLGEVPVAVVVLDPDADLLGRDLRRWLLDRVAPQAVPTAFKVADDLPRTSTGKVRRAALSAAWPDLPLLPDTR